MPVYPTYSTHVLSIRSRSCRRSVCDAKSEMSDTLTCARAWFVVLFLVLISAWPCQARSRFKSRRAKPWHAVHLLNYNSDTDLEALGQNLGKLAEMGINTLILEVDYNFAFKYHPELRRGISPITREGARKLAATCRKLGIRLIPEFQSLGHQSWKGETFPLLTVYPAFDLTAGEFPDNEGIYCREWDPLNAEVWRVV